MSDGQAWAAGLIDTSDDHTAEERIKTKMLTREELHEFAARCNPDPRHFEVESTGEKLTPIQRIKAAINHCRERISHYEGILESLGGDTDGLHKQLDVVTAERDLYKHQLECWAYDVGGVDCAECERLENNLKALEGTCET
jgi:hypothetical protein